MNSLFKSPSIRPPTNLNKINTLILQNCNFDRSCLGIIGGMINSIPSLTKLDLSHNGLTNKGFEFFEALEKNSTLKILLLKGCGLNGTSFPYLIQALNVNRCLEEIDITCNGYMEPLGFLQMMKINPSLKKFEMDRHYHPEFNLVVTNFYKNRQIVSALSD
jgi:hypothetical protein